MNDTTTPDRVLGDVPVDFDALPGTVPDDAVLCIAAPVPPEEYALPLRVTNRYASDDDCRLVVTSSVGADDTVEHQQATTPVGAYRLGIVDTTADHYLAALYQPSPTISLPRGELAQLSVALWELEEALSASCSTTHVVFRSLTPILAGEPRERVTAVLERVIDRQRSTAGLTVFGVEYTEHDEATMAALEALVDGIVWVERTGSGELRLEYRRIPSL